MSPLSSFVQYRVWPRKGVAGHVGWMALWPLSVLFGVAVRLRRAAYRLGLWRTAHAEVPVVSVGNLTVGGSGKTPFTLWLAERLRAQGWAPAILLRGYGGAARRATLVARDGQLLASVADAGDEAAMLGKRFGGVVVVARRRADGIAAAVAEGCDVLVLDDGFQHLRLARDCDVVLVGPGPGSLLPAGPYREPLSALRRASVVVRVERDGEAPPRLPAIEGVPVFDGHFVPTALIESVRGQWIEQPLGLLAGRRVATVSGIANPKTFHDAVRQWEAQIVEIIALDDHHAYTVDDWRSIAHRTRDVELVLTTEKDLVKLEAFPFARGKLLALRIAPEIERAAELVAAVSARLGQQREEEGGMAVSQELLDILACPKCKGDIQLAEKQDGLVCKACKLMYPIRDDIPVMLIDEAIKLE